MVEYDSRIIIYNTQAEHHISVWLQNYNSSQELMLLLLILEHNTMLLLFLAG